MLIGSLAVTCNESAIQVKTNQTEKYRHSYGYIFILLMYPVHIERIKAVFIYLFIYYYTRLWGGSWTWTLCKNHSIKRFSVHIFTIWQIRSFSISLLSWIQRYKPFVTSLTALERHKEKAFIYTYYMCDFCWLNTVFSGAWCMTTSWPWRDMQCSCPSASAILGLTILWCSCLSGVMRIRQLPHVCWMCFYTVAANMQAFPSITVCRHRLSQNQQQHSSSTPQQEADGAEKRFFHLKQT